MKKLFLTGAFLLVVLLFATSLHAQTSVTVTSVNDPTLQPTDQGTFFNVEVWAHNVEKLWGYQYTLKFDPNIIQLVEYVSGPSFPSPAPTQIGSDYIDITYYTYPGDLYGVTAEHVLLTTLTFVVAGQGESVFDITYLILANVYGTQIPATVYDGYFSNTTNQPPIASFTASKTSANTAETIAFDASSSYDPDGFIVSYSWQFGDGSTAEGVSVIQSYASEGIYTVVLIVTDDKGSTSQASQDITVSVSAPPETELPPAEVDLVRRAAWPEHHNFVISKDEDGLQTLYAKVRNFSATKIYLVNLEFIVNGQSFFSDRIILPPGTITGTRKTTIKDVSLAMSFAPGKYIVTAQVYYSLNGRSWAKGNKIKRFSFTVVQ